MTFHLQEGFELLRCAHCKGDLTVFDGAIGCAAGHRFDLAKHGYLPLLGPRARTDTGDAAAMVAARAEFLGASHFAPIAEAVAAAGAGPGGNVLEIGAGTGYYLAATDPSVGVAVDSSRYAARRAAKVHPRVLSVLADAWAPLPVRDAVIDTVLVVFAPRTPDEIARVLVPGGRAIVVTPGVDHLAELRGPLGLLDIDDGKAAALPAAFGAAFAAAAPQPVTALMSLSHNDTQALAAMGPSARHRTADQFAAAIAVLPDPVIVTLSVTVTVLRRLDQP